MTQRSLGEGGKSVARAMATLNNEQAATAAHIAAFQAKVGAKAAHGFTERLVSFLPTVHFQSPTLHLSAPYDPRTPLLPSILSKCVQNAELRSWLATEEARAVDIDAVLVPATAVEQQLLDTVCTYHALEDLLFYLSRALQAGAISGACSPSFVGGGGGLGRGLDGVACTLMSTPFQHPFFSRAVDRFEPPHLSFSFFESLSGQAFEKETRKAAREQFLCLLLITKIKGVLAAEAGR